MIVSVFENENFIVCDKPAGVLSVPDRMGPDSDRQCLGIEIEKQKKIRIFPVHRLDFEVSGLIIYAKNQTAHQKSQDWFLHKKIFKNYLAISHAQNFEHVKTWPAQVQKKFIPEKIEPVIGQKYCWKSKILRGKKRTFAAEHGEWAETHAVLNDIKNEKYYWTLSPVTGKPHQLRFEMSSHGFPLIGDELYGSAVAVDPLVWPYGGLCLRAVELNLQCIRDRLGLPEKITL